MVSHARRFVRSVLVQVTYLSTRETFSGHNVVSPTDGVEKTVESTHDVQNRVPGISFPPFFLLLFCLLFKMFPYVLPMTDIRLKYF